MDKEKSYKLVFSLNWKYRGDLIKFSDVPEATLQRLLHQGVEATKKDQPAEGGFNLISVNGEVNSQWEIDLYHIDYKDTRCNPALSRGTRTFSSSELEKNVQSSQS